MAPRVSTVWMPAPLLRWASSVHACHAILHGMADWDAVRFFLELARAKTLARAARRLRVDYTTVGRRVSAFERELGAKLFERTPDGFVLTDAGESIRAAAEQMEQSALAVEQRALGADRRLSGTVRVAAAESAGHAVVLPAMRELRASPGDPSAPPHGACASGHRAARGGPGAPLPPSRIKRSARTPPDADRGRALRVQGLPRA